MKFTNHCETLCDGIDITPLTDWLVDIPFDEWPQQTKLFGEMRPAFINDPNWRGFGDQARNFIERTMRIHINGLVWYQPMVSVVMAGHFIATHTDPQALNWCFRVHVPLWTNPQTCLFMDRAYHLKPGKAYKVNTERRHSIINHGDTPRVHFMFDVRTPDV